MELQVRASRTSGIGCTFGISVSSATVEIPLVVWDIGLTERNWKWQEQLSGLATGAASAQRRSGNGSFSAFLVPLVLHGIPSILGVLHFNALDEFRLYDLSATPMASALLTERSAKLPALASVSGRTLRSCTESQKCPLCAAQSCARGRVARCPRVLAKAWMSTPWTD